MANDEQVFLLTESGPRAWNRWRAENPDADIDLTGAILREADLRHANLIEARLANAQLTQADLRGAELASADLSNANVPYADLRDATLTGATLADCELLNANLRKADLTACNLSNADLRGANLTSAVAHDATLSQANLIGAELRGAEFRNSEWSHATLGNTDLAGADLSGVTGLDTCKHIGPSIIDHRALALAKTLPAAFLEGCGLPDVLIRFLPTLRAEPDLKHDYLIVSHAAEDHGLAVKLRGDLNRQGLRCWLAEDDTSPQEAIGATARALDKAILLLSRSAVMSHWAENEVAAAATIEAREDARVLHPVVLDDALATSDAAWARELRDSRPAIDFSGWREDGHYAKALAQLLAELGGG